jgi:membrane-bound ClpP family serine protease
MKRLVLIIGIILIVLWLLGFFAFHVTSPIIHALIIIGVILIILDILNNQRKRNWW